MLSRVAGHEEREMAREDEWRGTKPSRFDVSICGEGNVERIIKGDPRVLQIFLTDRLSNRPA